MRGAAFVVVLLSGCVAAAGCGDEKALPTAPGGPVSETATFTRVQNEVFTRSCALPGCHAGPREAANEGLVLSEGEAYINIFNVPANQNMSLKRIAPFDPDNSYLVRKITPFTDINGARMPQTGSITDAQRKLVTDWVRRGAPND